MSNEKKIGQESVNNKAESEMSREGMFLEEISVEDISKILPMLRTIPAEECQNILRSFFNTEALYTVTDIATLTGKTAQAVASMIRTNKDFPKPLRVKDTNYYFPEPIITWLVDNNKLNQNDVETIQKAHFYGTQKSIVIVGGAGSGKSTLFSGFVDDSVSHLIKLIFSGAGKADTESSIVMHLSNVGINYVIFHYADDIDTIPIEITESNVEKIQKELSKLKERAKELRNSEISDSTEKLAETYVELVVNPSLIMQNLMKVCNFGVITITDTPGIDSEHSGESVATADAVIVVLSDRNDTDTIFKAIADNIIPKSGPSKFIYVYNSRFALPADYLSDEEIEKKYQLALNDALLGMEDYMEDFKSLHSDVVINTSISAYKPEDTLLCMPSLDKNNVNKTDESFYQRLSEYLVSAFSTSQYAQELRAFVSEDEETHNFFSEIIKKVLEQIIPDIEQNEGYNVNSFIEEEHGRTKTWDGYRIDKAYKKLVLYLKENIYKFFEVYKTEDFSDNQAAAIRLAYLTMCEALMNRIQFGFGTHPWEDVNSATHMLCEEILADDIVTRCISPNDGVSRLSYVQVMLKNKIKSGSWNMVTTRETDWTIAKLQLIHKYGLAQKMTKNLSETMILVHFIPSMVLQTVLAYYGKSEELWSFISDTDKNNIIQKLIP